MEDESHIANGIVVHNCRSGLAPIPITREVDENMIFEKRDFSSVLDDPAKVDKAFQNIGKFNDKYRVSKYVLDQDLAAKIMFEKGLVFLSQWTFPKRVYRIIPHPY